MTISHDDLLIKLGIGEDFDFEVKDGSGGLPKDFWPTYSAFANTKGGFIVLGVKEVGNDSFEITGLKNPGARQKELWDLLQNKNKTSVNLLDNNEITINDLNGRKVLVVRIPQATRKQRPVFLNGNPMSGTYKRGFQGDYHCDEDEVRRMFRDASDEFFDTRIFQGATIADLDSATLISYRNRFRAREGDHPWLALNDQEFLEKLGGWKKDRESGEEGVTLAGLLMFGTDQILSQALPQFRLDYQERLSNDPEVRWTHRITQDGRWEGNLFNFYFRVIARLTQDLEVPFKLDKDLIRLGETHVHEALREALVNCLIHADHSSSKNIQVIKTKHAFMFINPGRLRIPVEQVYKGGVSDCRNPNLQKMFLMMGIGERAGSGIGKILRAWREQEWLLPKIRDSAELELTGFVLPTTSMIPESVLKDLEARLGPQFRETSELERLALVLAHQEGEVTNTDIQRYRREHPAEIGKMFRGLVNRRWLQKQNQGRATSYELVGKETSGAGMLDFDLSKTQHKPDTIQHKDESIQHKPDTIQHKDESIQHKGGAIKHEISDNANWKTLETIANPIRTSRRAAPRNVDTMIIQLCKIKPLTAKEIAQLIRRNLTTITTHYLPRLVKEGRLKLLHPEQPRHPDQAYIVNSSVENRETNYGS